jgi:hypothetical protein
MTHATFLSCITVQTEEGTVREVRGYPLPMRGKKALRGKATPSTTTFFGHVLTPKPLP